MPPNRSVNFCMPQRLQTPRLMQSARVFRAAAAPVRECGRRPLRQHRHPCGAIDSISLSRNLSTTPHRRIDYNRHERGLENARPLIPDSIAKRFSTAGTSRHSKAFTAAVVVAAIAFYFYNSQMVPVTGRRRFNYLSDELIERMHRGDAAALIKEIQRQGGRFLSERDPRTIAVKTVMRRLIPVSGIGNVKWEIYVIADDRTSNAFVLPGGKVFVHSGLLNTCRNEDSLAAVLGHEIAHNTASHAAERISAGWIANLTAGSLFFLLGALPGLSLFCLWSAVGGFYLRDLLFHLPMGRKQETEADYIGLMMMAEACYDPQQAVGFWKRMEALQKKGGPEVPEILSTHPSNQHRIGQIIKWMPEALEKRAESDCRGTAAFADKFRTAMRQNRTVRLI